MINPAQTDPISLRAYARRRAERGLPGATAMAVSKAITSGRLVKSVVRDERGQPKISDPDLADREWGAGTDHSRAPAAVKERASASARAPEVAPPGPIPPPIPPAPRRPRTDGDEVQEPENLSLAQESAREKFWKAQTAELDYRERLGELVDAKEMAAQVADAFTRVRTRLLAVPTRARQAVPHLTAEDGTVLADLVREALEELTLELSADEEPAEAEAAHG